MTSKKLAVDWWIRQRHARRIRLALCWGFAEHCYNVVENRFESNKQMSRWPTSWNSYWPALAYPSDGNLSKKRTGGAATQIHECLGIATVVGASPQDLAPPKCAVWLVSTVMALCVGVPIKDAELFVDYCIWQYSRYQQQQALVSTAMRMSFLELSTAQAEIEAFSKEFDFLWARSSKVIGEVKHDLEKVL